MISVANPVGRVCLARFVQPFDVPQVDKLAQEIRAILVRLSRPAIFCSDIRGAQIFPPDVSERITTMLKSDNPKVERSAVLIGESTVFGLQLERMFREAGNPGRRVFRTTDSIAAWLDEVLTPLERQHMRAHLADAGD